MVKVNETYIQFLFINLKENSTSFGMFMPCITRICKSGIELSHEIYLFINSSIYSLFICLFNHVLSISIMIMSTSTSFLNVSCEKQIKTFINYIAIMILIKS